MADERIRAPQPVTGPGVAQLARKRVGRGEGSGVGKTSGRGHKGLGARSGAKKRVNFEGSQNPSTCGCASCGPHMKKSMPFENFRTSPAGQPPRPRGALRQGRRGDSRLASRERTAPARDPVKVLGRGDLSKALTVHAHAFSKAAREKIEAAGGTVQLLES